MKKFCYITLLLTFFPALVWGATTSTPPTSAASQVVPNGSVNGYSLGQLNSPTNYQVPRGHVRTWKPFNANQTVDSGGTQFNGRTAISTVEISDDATQAQVIFANTGSSAYTLTNAGIWGTSQMEPAGQVVANSAGLTIYDSTGTQINNLALLSFGNNGVDSAPNFGFTSTIPANNSNFLTTGTSSGTTLNMVTSGFTCPATGARIAIPTSTATNNPLVTDPTTVTACVVGTGVVTISQALRNTVPSGTTIYFMPPGFIVPASTNPPLLNLVYSDWVPLTTYSRIDGPVVVGQAILNAGTPLGGTVQSLTATGATMSSNLSSGIPAGTALKACWSATTTGTITPNYSLQFAANANIVSGMIVTPYSTGFRSYLWPQNSIASVATSTNTTVTLASPLPENQGASTWSSGTTFYFLLPATTTAPTTTSSAVLVLASTSGISTGMAVFAGSGPGAIGGTVQSVDSATQVTMTQNVTIAVPSGQTIYFRLSANTNADATVSNVINLSPAIGGILPSMNVVSPGFPANTYVMGYSSTAPVVMLGATTTINSGSTVYFCNNVTTSTVSPAGQPVINFASTAWPNRLVTLRVGVGSANANYYQPGGGEIKGVWPNLPGNPQRWFDVGCTVEGVLNVSAITNTTAGICNGNRGLIPYAIKFYSPRRGVTIAIISDSHHAGDTSTVTYGNMATRASYLLNNPGTLPVSILSDAWSGQPSSVFNSTAMQLIRSIQPEIVISQLTSANDPTTLAAISNEEGGANAIASYVRSYGGLPIMVPDYQRQLYGCNVNTAANEAVRLQGEALLNSAGSAGAITLDLPAISGFGDPVNGVNWFAPANSNDCIHANETGNSILATGLVNLLKPLLRY